MCSSAGWIAFNFYERWPGCSIRPASAGFSDTLCMLAPVLHLGPFARMTTETIAPADGAVSDPRLSYRPFFLFGAAGALVTLAIVILAFHAAPVHKKIFTTVTYDSKPPFGLGLDHQWLGFFFSV